MSSEGHRKIGEQLDLFHLPVHAAGQVCWHPRGLAVLRSLEDLVRELCEDNNYLEVRSPLVCDERLWSKSGHLDKFADRMFAMEVDGRLAALKPMNCPGHCDLYGLRPRSYRELPLRFAELGHVHRLESPGEINGLLRARGFCIDDAHLFCRDGQVEDEVYSCLALALGVYRLFDMPVHAELSLRPQQRLGADDLWDRAEDGLRSALARARLEYEERPGEGAFYGPKVDLHVEDSLGRSWQLGSVQLDYQLPQRFDLRYVAEDGRDVDANGQPRRPVMVHRALLGSLERFLGVVLEHYQGRLPLWLAPEAVSVLALGDEQAEAAGQLARQLRAAGIRCRVDARGPLGKRIRRSSELGVPLAAVLGPAEVDAGLVALRRGGQRFSLPVGQAVEQLGEEVRRRG